MQKRLLAERAGVRSQLKIVLRCRDALRFPGGVSEEAPRKLWRGQLMVVRKPVFLDVGSGYWRPGSAYRRHGLCGIHRDSRQQHRIRP